MIRRYATPLAFKQALEQRLKSSSANGVDFARRRQLLVFDRFLARLVAVVGDAVTLKGGLVLEIRLARARTTKDVDLRMMGSSGDVLDRLQASGRLDLRDYMLFEVQPDSDHPEIRNEGMQYEGYRYRAECRLAGAAYGRPFGVDVAFGDPLVGEPDRVVAGDVPRLRGHCSSDAAPLPGRLPHRREAACPHPTEEPPKLSGERSARYCLARNNRFYRRGRASLGAREDVRIPRDSFPAGIGSGSAGLLGGALRRDGVQRRACLGLARRGYRSCVSLLEPCALRNRLRHLAAAGLALEIAPEPDRGRGEARLRACLSQDAQAR